jgi:predicted AAA+ superfamily ATPase
LLNLAALGADCGISAVTAAKWLSVLETSYLVMRLPPYHRNFGKRLVKTPKLYFLDVGLMAWLLGIKDITTLETHPARGALFETWVVLELVKKNFNTGQAAELFFWRDNVGHEVDVLLETQLGLQAIEIKPEAITTQAHSPPNTTNPAIDTRRNCRVMPTRRVCRLGGGRSSTRPRPARRREPANSGAYSANPM